MLWSLIVGGVIGWLAGLIMKGGGSGIIMNIIIGLVGSALGGFLFQASGIQMATGGLGYIIQGVIGSIVLILIARMLGK
jgi:uncharacterized membrane protein YeaQ/YmgE (transglycosylase-associated protein family)